MKARINTFALRATTLKSESLGVLGTVAHALPNEGEFRGVVFRDGTQTTAFRLTVSKDATSTQADVDLAKLAPAGRAPREGARYTVQPNGYLLLYVSEGPGGYHVALEAPRDDTAEVVFDSRNLNDGDLFIVTLLRPGHYDVTGRGVDGRGGITVTYPQPERKPLVPKEPPRIAVRESGFDPASVTVGSASGVVFEIHAKDIALVAECDQPDDGPAVESRAGRRRFIRRKFAE